MPGGYFLGLGSAITLAKGLTYIITSGRWVIKQLVNWKMSLSGKGRLEVEGQGTGVPLTWRGNTVTGRAYLSHGVNKEVLRLLRNVRLPQSHTTQQACI